MFDEGLTIPKATLKKNYLPVGRLPWSLDRGCRVFKQVLDRKRPD